MRTFAQSVAPRSAAAQSRHLYSLRRYSHIGQSAWPARFSNVRTGTRRVRPPSLLLIVSLLILVTTPMLAVAPAEAEAPLGASIDATASARAVTYRVFRSDNPQAAFAALDADQRAAFINAFRHQSEVTIAERSGRWTPTAAERAAMTRAPASSEAPTSLAAPLVSGCWYHYWFKSWSDLGIHDGDSWMQLNWCATGGRVTSWSQSNVGCAGHSGAGCSVSYRADLNVGWEVRSSRYFNAKFLWFSNTFCMQIRGGATGLYSQNSSANSGCPLQ